MRAPAKVNLALAVGAPRPDGYHDLATVFHAVSLYDEVDGDRAADDGVSTSTVERRGPGADACRSTTRNLAVARRPAARRARRRRSSRCTCTSARTSRSPAGMAGGSADAAAALVACDALWRTGLGRAELAGARRRARQRRAVRAASAAPRSASGRGERLTPVLARGELPLGVRPRATAGCSTPAVYAESTGCAAAGSLPEPRVADALMHGAALAATPTRSARALRNDLQAAAVSLLPDLARRSRSAASTARSAASSPARARPSRSSPATPSTRSTSPWRSTAVGRRAGRCARAHGPVPGARVVERVHAGERLQWPNLVNARGRAASPSAPRTCSTASRSASPTATGSASSGRNGGGKTTLLRVLAGGSERRRRAGSRTAGGLTRRRARARPTTSTPRSTVRARGPRRRVPEHVWAGDAARPRRARGPARRARRRGRRRARRVGRPAVRRRAPPGRAGRAARRRPRPAAARRADQPPRRRGRRLARRAPVRARPAGSAARRRHARPVVPRRGRDAHLGGRRRRRSTPTTAATRRTCWPGPSATGSAARHRGAARTTCCARSWPGCAAGRRRARASRRFRIDAANALIADEPPPRDDVELVRFATARLGKDVVDLEDVTRRARATGRCSTTSPGGSRPGDRVGIVGVNGAGKTTLLRLLARRRWRRRRAGVKSGQDRAHRPTSPRRSRELDAVADLRVHRGGRGGPRGRPARRQGDHRRRSWPSGSASPASGSRRRSATCPAASGGGCSCCGC